jgi:hypothetical protein
MSYHTSNSYSRDINSRDYFLYWLENDILYCLNDEIPIYEGISPNLVKMIPDITMGFLMKNVSVNELPDRICKIWTMMDNEKRNNCYRTLMPFRTDFVLN